MCNQKNKKLWLKVLSYWNLNTSNQQTINLLHKLKVLSYWNLNNIEYDTVTSEQT